MQNDQRHRAADNTVVVVMGDNGPFMQYVDKSGQSDRIYLGACNSLAAEGARALDPDSIGARTGE